MVGCGLFDGGQDGEQRCVVLVAIYLVERRHLIEHMNLDLPSAQLGLAQRQNDNLV